MNNTADKDEELLKVLDEFGNETGEIKQRQYIHANHLFHNEIALWVIDKKNKQILAQRRSRFKKNAPNKIAICAGHVCANETIEEALKKEAKEELGIDVNKYNVFEIAKTKGITEKNSCFTTHFGILAYIPIKEIKIQEEELSEVFYLNYEKFKQMILTNDPEIAIKCTPDIEELLKIIDKIVY